MGRPFPALLAVLAALLVLAVLVPGAAADAPAAIALPWTPGSVPESTLLDGTRSTPAPPAAPGVTTVVLDAAPGEVALRLPVRPGERIFGMGERFGTPELNGQLVRNRVADGKGTPTDTSYSPSPFLLSSRGYGLSLETTAEATLDLRTPGTMTIRVAVAHVVLHVLTGSDPAAVLERHTALVGLPPAPPAWGLGVWKSLVGGPERVLADVDRLRVAGVPLDAVWIYDLMDPVSGVGWPWPVYRPVPLGSYPDPRALVAALHARGVRVLGYLSPFVVPGRPGFDDALAHGLLVRDADGRVHLEPWMQGEWRAYVDLTNPAAVAWWSDRVRRALAPPDAGGLGLDGGMQDYGEDAPAAGNYADGTPGPLAHNLYPVLYARAARAAAQSVRPDATVLFARSGYDGTQSETTGRFTGDQTRDWDARTGLPSVLAGMLDGSVSGWPYWGPDIGGFYSGSGERDRELWSRWVQLGALSPVMRDMLGAQFDPIGVQTDAGTVALFRGYALLHTALEPALERLATEAHTTGLPLMRPLWLVAPAEPAAWAVDDEYLLGTDLLVAPVLARGATDRGVYLPPGTWRSYWTGEVVGGPRWISAAAPTDRIPLYVRDGSPVHLPAPDTLGL